MVEHKIEKLKDENVGRKKWEDKLKKEEHDIVHLKIFKLKKDRRLLSTLK